MKGFVAIVLHAHLPYVRHPEHERSLEERWLFEALWESYLPLTGALDRVAARGVLAPITLSVSPPLACMLNDDLLRYRFDDHLSRLDRLAAKIDAQSGDGGRGDATDGPFTPALRFYRGRIRDARALWDRLGGDVLGAWVKHHFAGNLELITTTASHAYLPGLVASRGSAGSLRAQLRIGLRAFEAMTGVRASGMWLPECAYDPAFAEDLASAGVRYSVLDAHGVELATPRPPRGVLAPLLAPTGVAFFGRDPSSATDVWSRATGYPGDPLYREFYRDVGFDLPASELDGEVGPNGSRLMTGLKLHRVTGPGPQKEPYDPAAASARARAHASHFLEQRAAALAAESHTGQLRIHPIELQPPLVVAPFDAELFGHWWLEGPEFLERVLEGLDASSPSRARPDGIGATTLGGYLSSYPSAAIAEPAPSSWGEGGFGEAWTGPATAALWRHTHHLSREVEAAAQRWRRSEAASEPFRPYTRAHCLEQSIRELLLLQASDWAFMLARGEMATYAESRVRAHATKARRFARLASSPDDAFDVKDNAWIRLTFDRDHFLKTLHGPALLDAFDPWP